MQRLTLDYHADLQFDPAFAIRGLHYGRNMRYFFSQRCLSHMRYGTLDFNKGWLMKIDSIANIQLNTVHGNDSENIKNQD